MRITFLKKTANTISSEIRHFVLPDYLSFSFLAVIIGVIVGLGAILFHETINLITKISFGELYKNISFLSYATIILLPSIGMLIQALMRKLSPDTAQKAGVPEVIKAVSMKGGLIKFRTTVFHFFAPAICIGTGGTVGPEGPAAQIGGGLASKFSQILKLSDSKRRIFTSAGAGAAIAAVFNTPLGGVFFALEIILLNDFQPAAFSALILASVSASAVSRIFLGNSPAFQFTTPSVGNYDQYYLFIILGVLSGLFSILFINYSEAIHQLFSKKILKRIPRWSLMVLVGIIVGITGFFYSDIFGIGYNTINKLLAQNITWQVAIILFVLKFILVPLILQSGGFGGIFAPALFMGASFSYVFSFSLNHFFHLNLDPTTFVLVGMGAFLGGINSIPIAAILIIFEMTKDYSFILPLMLAVIISTTFVQLFFKGSIHLKHLEQQGYQVNDIRNKNILKNLFVYEIMKKDFLLIPERTPLGKLLKQLLESPQSTFYLMNDEGKISGTITESELRPIITEYDSLREVLVAKDIARSEVITVKENDNLEYALKLFGKSNVDQLPVIDAENRNVIGIIYRQDLISAYNHESIKYNIADGFASELKSIKDDTFSTVAEGYSIYERKAPNEFVGKNLMQLKLRNKYGLEMLMVKHKKNFLSEEEVEVIIPTPDYMIKENDIVVLFGSDENIKRTRELD